jgi:hypothetical protein
MLLFGWSRNFRMRQTFPSCSAAKRVRSPDQPGRPASPFRNKSSIAAKRAHSDLPSRADTYKDAQLIVRVERDQRDGAVTWRAANPTSLPDEVRLGSKCEELSVRWGNRPASLWIAEDFWVLRFRLMVKRGPWRRPQASEGEAQHGPFCRIGRIGQGDECLHFG